MSASSELKRSSNPASNPLLTDNMPPSDSGDKSQEDVLPTSGEDSVDGTRQVLLEPPFDELQASSDSHDSSITNPEHDQFSLASAASQYSEDEDGNYL